MGYFGTKERTLRGDEVIVATSVFADSLPEHSRIYITNGLGYKDSPWTEAVTMSRSILNAKGWKGYWRMHIGEAGYVDTSKKRALLIHELTHVWQGAHSSHSGKIGGGLAMLQMALPQINSECV